MKTVLLLKAADERYRRALEAAPGLSAHFADVLSFRYVNLEALSRALLQLERFSALLVTSPRACIALKQALASFEAEDARQRVTQQLRGMTVLSVGAATSRELEPLGVACVGDDAGSAEVLAEKLHGDGGLLPLDAKSRPVLFLCGEKRSETLPGSFQERGLPMEQLVVYESCAVEALEVPEGCGEPAWVVFFSPSGLKVAKELALPWKNIKKAAIGKTTASAMLQHSELTGEGFWAPDVVAPKPTPEALAAAIFSFDEQLQQNPQSLQ